MQLVTDMLRPFGVVTIGLGLVVGVARNHDSGSPSEFCPSSTTPAKEGASVMSGDRLLSVDEVAERFGTGVRFVRRLVAEQRITVVRVGRHVRIPESAVEAFIVAGTTEARWPTPPPWGSAA